MITHGNIVAIAAAVITIIRGLGKNDVYMAYLPLAHVLELAAEVGSYPVFVAYQLHQGYSYGFVFSSR